MQSPERGDLLLRGSPDTGFELCDPITSQRVAGPFASISDALQVAQALSPRSIWQQSFDNRGRALGDMSQLPSRLP